MGRKPKAIPAASMPHTIDPFTDPNHPLQFADIKTRWLHRTFNAVGDAGPLPERYWPCVRVVRGDWEAMHGIKIGERPPLGPQIKDNRISWPLSMIQEFCRHFQHRAEVASLHAASEDGVVRAARGENTDMIPVLATQLRVLAIMFSWRLSAGLGVDAEGSTPRLCRTIVNMLKLSELQHLITPIPELGTTLGLTSVSERAA